jgi:hypothetical protein
VAILHNPESNYVKAMAEWEQRPSEYTLGGLRPGRPFKFEAYPRMMYQARQTSSGKWAVTGEPPSRFGFPDDNSWDRACQEAARFTESCQTTVNDEAEYARKRDEGWRDTPGQAMEFRDALEKAVSNAAAERNYRDRNMSEAALSESKAAEVENFGHLAEIPEKTIRRRKTA